MPPSARGRALPPRRLRELLERHDTLVALAADDPGRIAADVGALAAGRVGSDPPRVTLHIREQRRRRPEPGLLLFARGSPVGAVEDGARRGEVTRERLLPSGRGAEERRVPARLDHVAAAAALAEGRRGARPLGPREIRGHREAGGGDPHHWPVRTWPGLADGAARQPKGAPS